MLSNLRAFLRSGNGHARDAGTPLKPADELIEAGGANAFLSQSMQQVEKTLAKERGDRTVPTNRANEAMLHDIARGGVPGEVAPLLFPVGLVTGDGTARLGRQGYVLQTEDGGVPVRYLADPLSVTLDATVTRWLDLLLRRSHATADLGVGFAGAVVPEKLTLLADLYPDPIVVPPPLVAALEGKMGEQIGLAGACDSLLPAFSADPAMKDIYRRIDPGLSPYGAWRLFQTLLARIGMSIGVNLNFADRRLVRPEAGDHFFDLPMFEELFQTDSTMVLRAAAGITAQPDPHGYDGWRLWRNEMAPFDKIIQIYGDPLIGIPEQGQCAPAWWFAAFFREVQISHLQRYDHGYTTDTRPAASIFLHSEEGLEGPPLS